MQARSRLVSGNKHKASLSLVWGISRFVPAVYTLSSPCKTHFVHKSNKNKEILADRTMHISPSQVAIIEKEGNSSPSAAAHAAVVFLYLARTAANGKAMHCNSLNITRLDLNDPCRMNKIHDGLSESMFYAPQTAHSFRINKICGKSSKSITYAHYPVFA